MTRGEIEALIQSWVRAWSAQDLKAILACYDEAAELDSPLVRTVHGVDAIGRSFRSLGVAFTDVETDVHDVVVDVDNQQAVVVFTIHATHRGEFLGFPASKRRTATPSSFIFRLKNGRIVSERRLYDFGGFLMQLGIIKTKLV